MQLVNALSLAPAVNDWLANSRHPHILHIFDRVCNLINERREVLSIVTPQIGNGPFNVVVEDDVVFSDHLNLQSPISNSPNHLNLGDLTIHTTNAKLWSPRPDWEMFHAKRDDIHIRLMSLRAPIGAKQSLHESGIASSQRASALLAMTLPELPITNYQSPASNLQFSNSLLSSLANADLSSCITAAKKLAGLGQGLTPAGDDFIMGALYAAWIIHPTEVANTLAREIVQIAAPLTTSLSAAWLRSAGKGEAGILWHEFFDALSSPASSLHPPINKILSVGETSGADALAGFIAVFTGLDQLARSGSNLWEWLKW